MTTLFPRVRRGIRRRGPATGTLLVLLLALGGPAAAGDLGQAPPTLALHQAWVRRRPPLGQVEQGSHGGSMVSPENTAVYLTVQNQSDAPESLIAVASPVATTSEFHATRLRNGIREMHPQAQFTIPAGGRLEMQPGGAHIMLLGLTQALRPGDMVPLVLTFRQAGPVAIEAVVK
jgi:copper(I)-binding protein